MILFDGTYRLGAYSRKSLRQSGKPVPSWRIRIIDLSFEAPDVHRFRPIMVFVSKDSRDDFPTDCASSLGTRILRDFDLKAKKILWIEQCGDPPRSLRVAEFRQKRVFGHQPLYDVVWRPLQTNECRVVERLKPETDADALE